MWQDWLVDYWLDTEIDLTWDYELIHPEDYNHNPVETFPEFILGQY